MELWEELRRGVYHIDGSYRNIYVLQTDHQDWSNWIAFVNGHYPVCWEAEGYNDGQPLEKMEADFIAQRWQLASERLTVLGSVFLEQVQVNCHFFVETEIENDIDPKQILSLADHERLMSYLVGLSTALGKEVIVTEENAEEAVWIRVNGSVIQFV
jgi:hypothetical protein